MSDLRAVLAAAVAVRLIESGVTKTSTGPGEQRDHVAAATLQVLTNFGLPVTDDAPQHNEVMDQISRRGGWTAHAVTAPMVYATHCLQCSPSEVLTHTSSGARRAAIRKHSDATGHTVIARWEQPSTFVAG